MPALKVIALLSLYAPACWGAPEFKNIREECRSNLAGIFLNIYSARDDASSRYTSLVAEKAGMEKELLQAEEKWGKLRLEIDKKDYNPSLQDERIAATSRIRHIKELIAEDAVRISKYSKDITILKSKTELLSKALGKIFALKITMLDKSPKHGKYTIQMEYTHPCSKFYAICPLPPAQAAALEAAIKLIKDDYADQLLQPACERYASVIPPTVDGSP